MHESVAGTFRTCQVSLTMSAHRGKAVIAPQGRNFRFLPLTDLGSSPCHTAVDLATKRNKIDGLGQECLGSAFQTLFAWYPHRRRP